MDAELRSLMMNGVSYLGYVAVFGVFGAAIGRVCRPRSGVAFAATCVGSAIVYVAVLLFTAPERLSRSSTAYDFIHLFAGWAFVAMPAIPVALFVSSHEPRPPKI